MKTTLRNYALLILIAAFLTPLIIQAQGRHGKGWSERKEKIESHRIAFLTEKMELSPEDAAKFWPVYNENRQLMDSLRREFRSTFNYKPEDIPQLSDEEAGELLDAQIEHQHQMQELHEAFNKKLRSILTPHQILRMIKAEEEFKLKLMHRVREGGAPSPNERGR